MADGPPRVAAVVGAGTMGAGIAQVALEAGWHVRLFDVAPGAIDRARSRIWDGLLRRASKLAVVGAPVGVVDPTAWARERLARLEGVATLADAATAGAELIVEAAIEDLGAKRDVFAALDAGAPPTTILASNTSALSIARIAEATYRPERVIGLHFFNPAPVLPLVEIVSTRLVDPAVLARASEIVASWGKVGVRCADSPGFIVNRVNRPFTLEALRMLESGKGTVAGIDDALRSARFPMGPFELMDLVGLDVNLAAARGVWEGLGAPDRLRPSPIQERLVAAGRLGRKTGEGFYRYAGSDRIGVAGGFEGPAPAAPLEPGTIVERIRSAIHAEAVLARDEGVASEEEIDLALRLGAAHPEGPFARAAGPGAAALRSAHDA